MSLTPRFTITNSITASLAQVERARGFLEAARLSAEWVTSMQERALVSESITLQELAGLIPGGARRTLQRDLTMLTEKGVVRAEGGSRRIRYVRVP